MATVSRSVDALAAATGNRFDDAKIRGRLVREADLVPMGARGLAAPHLEPEHLTNLFLGVLGGGPQQNAGELAISLRDLHFSERAIASSPDDVDQKAMKHAAKELIGDNVLTLGATISHLIKSAQDNLPSMLKIEQIILWASGTMAAIISSVEADGKRYKLTDWYHRPVAQSVTAGRVTVSVMTSIDGSILEVLGDLARDTRINIAEQIRRKELAARRAARGKKKAPEARTSEALVGAEQENTLARPFSDAQGSSPESLSQEGNRADPTRSLASGRGSSSNVMDLKQHAREPRRAASGG